MDACLPVPMKSLGVTMIKRIAALAVAIVVGVLNAVPGHAADGGWKAGAATVNITPTAPIWMSGYSRDRPGDGKQQDLWAKALALEAADGHRALLITMDLVGIDRPTSQRVCELLAKRYGLERRQIALNCSHTHSGPAIGRNLDGLLLLDDAQQHRVDEYTHQLVDKLVTLAGEAIGRLQPCRVEWGQGYCTVAVNRRTNTRKEAARVRELGGLKGPSDFDVPVLTVRDTGGKLQAVVFGYTCHPTTLPVEYQWSGDYAGYAQAALEAAHPDAIAMFWAGCFGDQAPRPNSSLELTEANGRRLAVAVDEVLGGAMRPLAGSLTTIYDEIPLRLDKQPTAEQLQKDTASRNKFTAALARRLLAQLDRGQPLATTYPYPVQLWQLGDVRWIFLGGEVVVDYALRLKREFGPGTWVAGYSNDVMAYIPSLRVLREGGYEGLNAQVYYGLPTRWSEDVESQIVEQVQREVAQISATARVGMTKASDQSSAVVSNYNQWKLALESGSVADPIQVSAPPGFEVQLVRTATAGEGSWISLAFDPQGRAVIGREDRGLLRMTLAESGRSVTKVETIDDTLLECRGLLFAHGSLYANANNSKGFYRLRDTDGDDRFDRVERLKDLPGGAGHGRNGLALGPDGRIYMACGNNVQLPKPYDMVGSPLAHFALDRLLPCAWNEFLFDAGVTPPAGFIARTDAAGQHWELFAGGFRNPYGLAFNDQGDLFTYDADMEWDAGAPWYRPTRVTHVVSGGEYGWRHGTSVWPDHFADMLPGVVDIGLGSPTGVKFGTRSRFPDRWRRALYILDWAYGRILAVHLDARGASCTGQAETFVQGRPLNVTDLDFGPDGAMYFVVGGRRTQAALYRVCHTGSAKAYAPAATSDVAATSPPERKTRLELEQFHGAPNPAAVDAAWPYLGSNDRWLRSAARVALEHQPLETWRSRALIEPQPLAALTACLALARVGGPESRAQLTARAVRLLSASAPGDERLTALRALELIFLRLGHPPAGEAAELARSLESLYPAATWPENQLLCELLVYLDSSGVIEKSLTLMHAAPTQEEQLFYLYALRNVRQGWTMDARRQYFAGLKRAETFHGAHYILRFVTFIRTDALDTLTARERQELAPVIEQLGRPTTGTIPTVMSRPLVRNWTADELLPELSRLDRGRDFARGKAMFTAALCIHCHRFRDEGVPVGPDLAAIAARFSRRDMLEAILLPSKVVEEKYRSLQIETDDGRMLTGQIAGANATSIAMVADPSRPTDLVRIPRDSILSRVASRVSIMPTGLLNTLGRDEILDLLAYLESGGDPQHRAFRAAERKQ
jgi:hypothetical protein